MPRAVLRPAPQFSLDPTERGKRLLAIAFGHLVRAVAHLFEPLGQRRSGARAHRQPPHRPTEELTRRLVARAHDLDLSERLLHPRVRAQDRPARVAFGLERGDRRSHRPSERAGLLAGAGVVAPQPPPANQERRRREQREGDGDREQEPPQVHGIGLARTPGPCRPAGCRRLRDDALRGHRAAREQRQCGDREDGERAQDERERLARRPERPAELGELVSCNCSSLLPRPRRRRRLDPEQEERDDEHDSSGRGEGVQSGRVGARTGTGRVPGGAGAREAGDGQQRERERGRRRRV
jgi:hypothetical protein